MTAIQVFSEIGKLTKVLLKRPGAEVENLTPATMAELLFDDIPYLKVIQQEHDCFAQLLREEGITVCYLEQLAAEAIEAGGVKIPFVVDLLDESKIYSPFLRQELFEYLMHFDTPELVAKVMAGVRSDEIQVSGRSLLDFSRDTDNPFYLKPMPSLYFTRDSLACVGNGLMINSMMYEARKRESLFVEYMIRYHPDFQLTPPIWLDRDFAAPIEGGDVLVLNKEVIAVGISQRTSAKAIEQLARNLLNQSSSFTKVLAIKLPNQRAMMHLDTVFTMVDRDKFTIHPAILTAEGLLDIYVMELVAGELQITPQRDLQQVLKKSLGLSELILIPTGGGDAIAAAREQWNDGSNTLAIAPGKVVTYDRNYVSNQLLRRAGITVLEIPSGELSRGRGGPRCMSQPFWRESI